jgi:hypothetical protein
MGTRRFLVVALSNVSQPPLRLLSKTASARGVVFHTRHGVPVESVNSRIGTALFVETPWSPGERCLVEEPLEACIVEQTPTLRHRCKSPLFVARLEGEPSVRQFGADANAHRVFDPPPVRTRPRRSSTVVDRAAALRARWLHLPHVPSDPVRVVENAV